MSVLISHLLLKYYIRSKRFSFNLCGFRFLTPGTFIKICVYNNSFDFSGIVLGLFKRKSVILLLVRNVVNGSYVEMMYPINSGMISCIFVNITRKLIAHSSKLYFMRKLSKPSNRIRFWEE